MKLLLIILGFIVAYILGGRKIGVPYAVAFAGPYWAAVFSLSLDIIQIPFFYFIYSTGRKIGFIGKKRINEEISKHKKEKSGIIKRFRKFGSSGIFILSMLPSFGGGVWSSVLLAFMLKTDRKIAYFLIIFGSLAGIILLAFAAQGIINLMKIIFI